MRFILLLLISILYSSFLSAEMPSFKFTLGSNLGNIPFEINNINKDIKKLIGVKINNLVLSPNFSSFMDSRILSNFSNNKNSNDDIFIKFKLNF